MRTYIFITGIVFALLVVVHVARAWIEGFHVLKEPFFAGSTILCSVFSVWALRLLFWGGVKQSAPQ